MNVLKMTKEIERHCKNSNRVFGNGLRYSYIITNYDIRYYREIPRLLREEVDEEDNSITYESVPVLIYNEVRITEDEQAVSHYIPGFYIKERNKEGSSEGGEFLKVALTRNQIISYEDYLSTEDKSKFSNEELSLYLYVDSLGYDEKFSEALSDYLGDSSVEGGLNSFNECICMYHELNELTYIDIKSLNLLKKENIGQLINNYKINKEDPEEYERLYKLIETYINRNIEVFSVISNRGKKNMMTVEDVMYSDNKKTSSNNFSYHFAEDPLRDKLGDRNVGNLSGWLPTFNTELLRTILVGNFPFMTFTSKILDSNSFNSDPLYNVKRYVIQRSRKIIELLKSNENLEKILTKDEKFVLNHSDTFLEKSRINSMYSTKFYKDMTRPPRPTGFGDFYEIYMINFAVANIVLKSKGVKYEGKIEQFLNFMFPVKLIKKEGEQ